jgi:hypothetical protein
MNLRENEKALLLACYEQNGGKDFVYLKAATQIGMSEDEANDVAIVLAKKGLFGALSYGAHGIFTAEGRQMVRDMIEAKEKAKADRRGYQQIVPRAQPGARPTEEYDRIIQAGVRQLQEQEERDKELFDRFGYPFVKWAVEESARKHAEVDKVAPPGTRQWVDAYLESDANTIDALGYRVAAGEPQPTPDELSAVLRTAEKYGYLACTHASEENPKPSTFSLNNDAKEYVDHKLAQESGRHVTPAVATPAPKGKLKRATRWVSTFTNHQVVGGVIVAGIVAAAGVVFVRMQGCSETKNPASAPTSQPHSPTSQPTTTK